MARFPLLVLPEPTNAERQKRGGGAAGIRFPSPRRQVERLGPKFQELEDAFDHRRARLAAGPGGLIPEQVLVLETVGSIDQFVRAVRRIDGLSWLGEVEVDDLEPDEEFFMSRDPARELRGRLYLVMSNQRGMEELRSLWERFQNNPEHPQFQYGRGRWRHLFQTLRDIRPWSPGDRLAETGLFEDWEQRAADGEERTHVEVELWCREQGEDRDRAEATVRAIIEESGGQVVGQAVLPAIAYHAMVADLPMDVIGGIVTDTQGALIETDHVMLLRPTGQARTFLPDPEDTSTTDFQSLPGAGSPVVAVLDGLPLVNHRVLDGRLIVDDPDGWEDEYQVAERRHGTAVSSVVLNGDLSNPKPINRPIYVRPIMKPALNDYRVVRTEAIPEEALPVDVVFRAIRRMLEGQGEEDPVAPSVRIVNLSVGDSRRQLDLTISPWARLIDYLAWQYGVLFIISAGNHWDNIVLDVTRAQLEAAGDDPGFIESAVFRALSDTMWHRRLRPPGEAMNAITVGASHSDASEIEPQRHRLEPCSRPTLPSVISAVGPGYRRSVKPEMMMPGGRQLLAVTFGNPGDSAQLRIASSTGGPGIQVAAPSADLDATTFQCGTSHAAAHATHLAARLHDAVEELRDQPRGNLLPANTVPLIKALLVHQGEITEDDALEAMQVGLSSYFLGYGPCREELLLDSTDTRATMLGTGSIGEDEGLVFTIPLPPSLAGRAVWRRLSITLAWLTPIDARSQKYRQAKLWFTPYGDGKGDGSAEEMLATGRVGRDWQAVQRGTVQHEIFEGKSATTFVDGAALRIKVSCRAETARLDQRIPFGLVVTLEVAEDVHIPVYQEIRDRIAVPVRVGA